MVIKIIPLFIYLDFPAVMELLVFFSSVMKNKWATISQLPRTFKCEKCLVRRGAWGGERSFSGRRLRPCPGHICQVVWNEAFAAAFSVGLTLSPFLPTPGCRVSQRRCPWCWAEGRPACNLKCWEGTPRKGPPERDTVLLGLFPSSPLSSMAGMEISIPVPRVSFKMAGTVSKERICDHLALPLCNYSQGTRPVLLQSLGTGTPWTSAQAVPGQRVPTAWLRVGGRLQNLGHNKGSQGGSHKAPGWC